MFHHFFLLVAVASLFACARSGLGQSGTPPDLSKNGFYDRDPTHLWNRLHRALFVRKGFDGVEYGFDQLDPLLWLRTKHLLTGPSHAQAIAVLDEFLATHGEKLITEPLKRAILQRDLWAVFDWAALALEAGDDSSETTSRKALERRLAPVIRRLALTKQEIEGLPDNYTAASRAENLPADLFSTNGAWVCVGTYGETPMAPAHVSRFGGRAAFLVFMQMPGGRKAVTDYLMHFREFPQPYIYENDRFFTNQIAAIANPRLPVFSNGTIFALVRQSILVSQKGELVPTHLTESVQIRRYNDAHPKPGPYGMSPPESQSMSEFVLSRERLFQGIAGGLRPVQPDEKDFRQFMDKGFDPLEESEREHKPVSESLIRSLDCMECHSGAGLRSVNSFLQESQVRTVTLPQLTEVLVEQQRRAARYWKQRQFSWGLLQGLLTQH